MKKTFLAAIAFLFAMPLFSNAQTWSGSTPGNIYYNSGNVGIGTTSPGQILDVQGTTTASTFHVQNFKSSGYTSTLIYGQMTQGNSPDYDLVGLYNNTSTLKYQVRGDGAVYMSGNVGIGTTIPTAAKLVLNSGTTNQNALVNGDRIGFTRTSDAAVVSYLSKTTDLGTSGTTNLHGYDGIIFRTSGPEYARMTITQDGNVGIGTTTPDKLLSVNGTIHSKEVLIDLTGWSDYVLKPAYRLPALLSVKTYIEKNRHLPDVPSEEDMVKNGLSVGEMNKLLMKKVEEITLYLIQQKEEKDKQIAELNQQIAELKNKIH